MTENFTQVFKFEEKEEKIRKTEISTTINIIFSNHHYLGKRQKEATNCRGYIRTGKKSSVNTQ